MQKEKEEEASSKEKEEEKRKKEKVIQENIVELERAITQKDLNPKQEIQDKKGFTEEQTN